MISTSAVSSNPDVMSGTLVFSHTRVPVKSLFDYLEIGQSVESFLSDFPTVQKDQAVEVLKLSEDLLFQSLNEHENRSR
jgi:uncharacterized protein (DUF433 family)